MTVSSFSRSRISTSSYRQPYEACMALYPSLHPASSSVDCRDITSGFKTLESQWDSVVRPTVVLTYLPHISIA
jgi:hypothetical protein